MEDYYDFLGIPHRRGDTLLTTNDIKHAYHRALLQHHPDKIIDQTTPTALSHHARPGKATLTIDQITTAFKVLSDPQTKAEYDRSVSLRAQAAHGGLSHSQRYFSGLDTVDLDDLAYDESCGYWWRACRCGQEQGFLVTETDLERNAQNGELLTGCRGCSLWLKVLYQSAEQDGAPANP